MYLSLLCMFLNRMTIVIWSTRMKFRITVIYRKKSTSRAFAPSTCNGAVCYNTKGLGIDSADRSHDPFGFGIPGGISRSRFLRNSVTLSHIDQHPLLALSGTYDRPAQVSVVCLRKSRFNREHENAMNLLICLIHPWEIPWEKMEHVTAHWRDKLWQNLRRLSHMTVFRARINGDIP